jgi:hypothetical protein
MTVVIYVVYVAVSSSPSALATNAFLWSGTIGTLILLVAYLLATVGMTLLVFVRRKMPTVPMWQVVIPVAAVVVLGYTLYRNVYPYPTGDGRWFPVVAGAWPLAAVIGVLAAPGTASRPEMASRQRRREPAAAAKRRLLSGAAGGGHVRPGVARRQLAGRGPAGDQRVAPGRNGRVIMSYTRPAVSAGFAVKMIERCRIDHGSPHPRSLLPRASTRGQSGVPRPARPRGTLDAARSAACAGTHCSLWPTGSASWPSGLVRSWSLCRHPCQRYFLVTGQQHSGVIEQHDAVAEQAPSLLGVADLYASGRAVGCQRVWTSGLVLAHNRPPALRVVLVAPRPPSLPDGWTPRRSMRLSAHCPQSRM